MGAASIGTVLVIDDESIIRWVLGQAFRPRYEVIEAGTVREGRLRFGERAAEGLVVLLDLHLPDGDGIGLVGEFTTRNRACPIVILTSSADEETKASALALGASAFIAKPFALADVVACVDEVAHRAA
jgi:DNA-binding NtrC family response regulator